MIAAIVPTQYSPAAANYRRIERAIGYLTENFRAQPSLAQAARHVGLSEFHFQRLFRGWAGISPKRFVQYLSANGAAARLRGAASVLEAAQAVGLSGGGRLHDLFIQVHAMTPGEWKAEGGGVEIDYGFHPTPFGECLIAATARGICRLAFLAPGGRKRALAELAADWPRARFRLAPARTRALTQTIFGRGRDGGTIDLLIKGSNFQVRVWEALLTMPLGTTTTYESVAALIGAPRSARAVANAVARNPVAFLIPCHRVIRKSGALGGYRWGTPRKHVMLAWEAAQADCIRAKGAGPEQPAAVE